MFQRYKSSAVRLTLGNTDTDNAYYHNAYYVFVGAEKPCQHPSDRVQKDMSCTPPEHALELVFPNPEKSYHCPLATRICRCIRIRTKPHAHKYTHRRKNTNTQTTAKILIHGYGRIHVPFAKMHAYPLILSIPRGRVCVIVRVCM
jgi:hypothetical protein